MKKLSEILQKIKDFISEHRTLLIYLLVSLIVGYLFTGHRKVYLKHNLEVNLELDSMARDGMYITPAYDSIIIEKLDSVIMKDDL